MIPKSFAFAAWVAVSVAVVLIGVRLWTPIEGSPSSLESVEPVGGKLENGKRGIRLSDFKFDRVTQSKFAAFQKSCSDATLGSDERTELLRGVFLDSNKARYLIDAVGFESCVRHLRGLKNGIHSDPNNSTIYSTLVRDLIESDIGKSIDVIEGLGANECDVNTFSLLLGRSLMNDDSVTLAKISSRLFPEDSWADRVGPSSLIAELKRGGLGHSEIIDLLLTVDDNKVLAGLVATKLLKNGEGAYASDPEEIEMLSEFVKSLGIPPK